MDAPARLALYGAALVAAFGASYLIAGAAVPDAVVAARIDAEAEAQGHGGHDEAPAASAVLPGLSLEADGYLLSPVAAPGATDEDGELSFQVLGPEGEPVTAYTEEHEKDLHLIVVREDGSRFRHVHPELDAEGTWSIPWTWDAAGTYRVFADFTPAAQEDGITLTRSISVPGEVEAVELGDDVRESRAGDFDVRLAGDLVAGGSSTLTVEVTRDGEPVTELEPYLGAFGHLVALRDGDLAYLHVHPEGAEPEAGQESGPTVEFATEAPTPGRYLLYFDFQVDGEVQTASFVVTTDGSAAPAETEQTTPSAPATEGSPSESPADDGHDDDH